MRFLDTNVLLYSISRDQKESAKHETAVTLIEQRDNALSVQVLQEFYVQATRPTRPDPIAHDIAVGLMRTWQRFPVQEITLAVMHHALDIKSAYGLSYWDAAIVAAASALGCSQLLSEDLSHGAKIADVVIANPFRQ